MNAPPAIFVMGPTGAGKTDLAVELVRHLPCEIISVDSALVYRGMDIGTAKPGPEVLAVAPHRLIDICDPAEAYSAARFREDALREMAEITTAGRIPLLVGGTMLYFHRLQHGLSVLPSADPETRAAIEEEARRKGWGALHARLAQVDPVAAARIHPNDPQRIQRALEVYQLTGRSLTELCAESAGEPFPYRAIKVVIAPVDREELRTRIAQRFARMLERGLLDEVAALYRRGDLGLDKPSIRAVGYRQVWEYLEGRVSYEQMVQRAVIATRQLAKRQLTWLRAEENAFWFDSGDSNTAANVLEFLSFHHHLG